MWTGLRHILDVQPPVSVILSFECEVLIVDLRPSVIKHVNLRVVPSVVLHSVALSDT